MPLDARAANAVVSLAAYLGKFFFPARLAVFYQYPPSFSGWEVAGALAILVLVTAGVILARRKCPYLLVGWLWYLGMMVPVIGLVQVGVQAMADRYTYLPMIGVTIALVWLLASLAGAWRWGGRGLGRRRALAVAALAGCAWQQTTYWRDSEALWNLALDCDRRIPLAQNNLGTWWMERGELELAIPRYQAALDIDPNYVKALNNLSFALCERGDIDGAIAASRKVLNLEPKNSKAHNSLGIALQRRGELDAALSEYQQAVDCDPQNAQAHNNLANMLYHQGKVEAAIGQYRQAIAINHRYVNAHRNLGKVLQAAGKIEEAIEEYNRVLTIDPGNVEARRLLEGATSGGKSDGGK